MACIEDLPNELFCEIFDYLDGYQLYESFMNLNRRFQKLVSYDILLRINLYSKHDFILEYICESIINQNKFRIISLHLENIIAMKYFWRLITIDSLFSCLQSLVINDVAETKLLSLLVQCDSLPRLYSLTISLAGKWQSLNNVYQLIFNLPFLKYLKISSVLWLSPVTLPFATDHSISSIEYLNLDNSTSLNDLLIILSYIARLRCLTCHDLHNENLINRIEDVSVPSHLTHIYFDRCQLSFIVLEIFMQKFGLHLQVLRLTTSENVALFNADHWENFIFQCTPNLEKFYLEYEEKIPSSFQLRLHHQQINRFTSSFWTKRKWCLQLEMNAPIFMENRMTFRIQSYRNQWYHSKVHRKSCALFPQNVELTITGCDDIERYQALLQNTKSLFSLVPITCLNMDLSCLSAELLINFISHLPNLHSLSLSGSLSFELNNL